MLHDIVFFMGESVSCLAQLDSVTLIYVAGDTLAVP